MSSDAEVLATVDRFFAALAAGDLATCGEIFTDDAVVWHNYDLAEQPKGVALQVFEGLGAMGITFDVVRRYVVPDGCIQQHVVRRTDADGVTREVAAIQRIVCRDGRISRIDEYMDLMQGMAFLGIPVGAQG